MPAILRLVAGLALAATLAACGQKAAAPAASGEVLNIYTARHYDADKLIYDAFTRATGVRVRQIEMKPEQLIERMKAEGAASPADVILMADAGALWRAEQAGLFQPLADTRIEQRIPAEIRHPEGKWFGFARRARVIAYDKAKVRPEEVASYHQLAGPRFKGKVCVRTSDNVYNLSLMAALIERWGRPQALAWARAVVANMAVPPKGGDTEQIRNITAGVCEVALTNSYYFLRMATDDGGLDGLGLSFPDQAGAGTHVNISGGGVAAHAPHKTAAIRFLQFLTEPEAQTIFSGANHEFPAVTGAKAAPNVAAVADFKADPMPVTVYGRRQAEAQQVFTEAGWR